MKKVLISISVTLGSIIVIIGIATALFFTGTIPSDLAHNIYSSIIGSKYYVNIGEPVISANALNMGTEDKLRAPDDIIGLYVDADEEYPLPSFNDAASFRSKVESDFIISQSIYINTCYYEPYSDVSPLMLKNPDGSSFDADEYITSLCRTYSLDLVVVFDRDYLSDSEGGYSFDAASSFIDRFSPDGVMFSDRKLYSDGDWFSAARQTAEKVAASYPELYCGIEVWNKASTDSSGAVRYSTDAMQSVVEMGLVDFVYIEAFNSLHDTSMPFGAVFSWWDSYAQQHPDMRFYCEHRNDRVCTDTGSWSEYNEISKQLKALREFRNFSGSCFYSATAVAENKSTSTQRIAVHYSDGYEEYMHINTIDVNRENNTVSFTGVASAYYKLLLNDEALRGDVYSSGSFSITKNLVPGMNTFSFEQCGRVFTYRVFSNLELINSYYPSQNVSLGDNEAVTVSAVCPSACTAFCVLNGERYEMTPGDYVAPDSGVPEGYSVFSRTLTVSSAGYEKTVIGTPVIIVSLDGTNDERICGEITLEASGQLSNEVFGTFLNGIASFLKEDVLETAPAETTSDSQPVVFDKDSDNTAGVSPFIDYGLGEALVCRIRYENVERVSVNPEKDPYHPDVSTLTSGTLDYVKSMYVTNTGFIKYELESGSCVYATQCELMCGSYRMPQNKLKILSCESEKNGFTSLTFDTDWIVPVNVSLHPMNFSTGYLNGSFNVTEFMPEYVDIAFSYTSGLTGLEKLILTENSVVSSYKVLSSGNDYILRLMLKETGSFCGYEVDTDELGNFVITLRNRSEQSIKGKVIMLDPGHGGLSMTGTADSSNNIVEKDIDLQIALKVRKMLEEMGATVVMTRETDIPLSLDDRMNITEDVKPDIFVSLHCDGSDYPNECGTHSFYYTSFSMPLAQSIHNSLVYTYRNSIYKDEQYSFCYDKIDKKIKFYPFQVTRISVCPSVLVEMGFLTNGLEAQVLADNNSQLWLARAISDGIGNYFNNY